MFDHLTTLNYRRKRNIKVIKKTVLKIPTFILIILFLNT